MLAAMQDEAPAKKRGRPAAQRDADDERVPTGATVKRSILDRLENFCNEQTIPPKRNAAIEFILDQWLSNHGHPDE